MSKCQRTSPSNMLEAHYKLFESCCCFRVNFVKLCSAPEEHDIFCCLIKQLRKFLGGGSILVSQVIFPSPCEEAALKTTEENKYLNTLLEKSNEKQ